MASASFTTPSPKERCVNSTPRARSISALAMPAESSRPSTANRLEPSVRSAKCRTASSRPHRLRRLAPPHRESCMSEFSFDIVSKVEKQALEDAVNQASREIATRFDFKNSKSSVELKYTTITIVSDDEMKRKNVIDILA